MAATTVQNLIDRAFAKSAAARPDSMMAPNEFIDRVGQCLREAFHVWGRVNPTVIATQATVAFNGTGWPRPADCLSVLKVLARLDTNAAPMIAAGTEITVVPFDDQAFAAGMPCLTELGQQFIGTGQLIDPTGGNLTVLYVRAPLLPQLVTDVIDPFFPPPFEDFIQYDLAAWMAKKDDRAQDQQDFLSFKSGILSLMVEWAEKQTYSVQQRHLLVAPPLTNQGGGRQSSAASG